VALWEDGPRRHVARRPTRRGPDVRGALRPEPQAVVAWYERRGGGGDSQVGAAHYAAQRGEGGERDLPRRPAREVGELRAGEKRREEEKKKKKKKKRDGVGCMGLSPYRMCCGGCLWL